MPYSTTSEIPPAAKKLSAKRQRQWMEVFNSAHASCMAEGGSSEKCEESAFAQAWGVVKKSIVEEDVPPAIFGIELPDCMDTELFVLALEKAAEKVDALPDSAFGFVDIGGEKDAEGKTTPRSLRHFPLHDAIHTKYALQNLQKSAFCEQATPSVLSAAQRFGIALPADQWKEKITEGNIKVLVKIASRRMLDRGLVYGVVYEPGVVDTQGDFATAEEIECAAHGFLPEAVMNIHHKDDIEDVQVVESYIAPCDFRYDDQLIRKGSWVLVTKILNEELRKAIADGEINAYSLEGTATRLDYEGVQ